MDVIRTVDTVDKWGALSEACQAIRSGQKSERVFSFNEQLFSGIPGAPFAYWVSSELAECFSKFPSMVGAGYKAWVGLQTNYDFQWVRLWWENDSADQLVGLVPFFKGGNCSPYYSDIYLSVRWGEDGRLIKEWKRSQLEQGLITANNSQCWNEKSYFESGLAWPSRTLAFSPRVLPLGCIFAHKGPAIFSADRCEASLLAIMAIMNSAPFKALVGTRLNSADKNARSYEVGIIEATPVPDFSRSVSRLAALSHQSWSLRRILDSTNETSHAFELPAAILQGSELSSRDGISESLTSIQAEIDQIAFDLYGFTDADRAAALGGTEVAIDEPSDDDDEDEALDEVPSVDSLLSWAIGVAFGRFDWRFATGERTAPPRPEPFDPLPAKSPGMLPDGAMAFHQHAGILVDDQGHPHDLARLVEQVLETVDASVAEDVRRWLQKDFFAFHLKRYSKSRRKAPIYWPLATASGSYTLWLYYPSLSDQTLFTAVNDFVDPKLEDVRKELQTLRDKGAGRSKQDEKSLEALVSLEHELADLRDSLLEIAPSYRPNHDDGVQITAAPLWKLFRHKPWQKVLKDTWAKLEKGDYDWAHLAMNYWPGRVRDKCVTDKSLAIAHGLEHLYVEPEPVEKKTRGRKKAGSTE